MKKRLISIILSFVMIVCSALIASAADDPSLAFREGDDITPYKDSQYFTRYTPWLKVLHLTSEEEIASGAHGGEGGQLIRCLDISPKNPNLTIFGTDTTGVWITTDGGEFWYNTRRNMFPVDIADVMCHPTDENILFAYSIGTHVGECAPGIYRSEDKGRSWTLVYKDYISSSTVDKLFAYDNSGNLYAVTAKGVIKSTDSGKTWSSILAADETTNDKDNTVRATSLTVSEDGQTIIACYAKSGFSLNGINVSYDSGATWKKIYISEENNWNAYSFVIDPVKSRYIVGVYNPDTQTYELYISSNQGSSWTKFYSEATGYDYVRNSAAVIRLRITEEKLYASYPSCDKNFRYIAYSSLDYVESQYLARLAKWKTINFESLGTGADTFRGSVNMQHSQGVDICGDIMYVCSAGPNKSTDGGNTWQRKSSGFSGLSITHFNMDENGRLILSCTDRNMVVSSSNYTKDNVSCFTPTPAFGGDTIVTRTLTDKHDSTGQRMICWYGNANTSKPNVGIIVSTDGGKTYEDYTSGAFYPRITDPVNKNTAILEYDETEENTIYASCATSKDNGVKWEPNPYFLLDVKGNEMLAWDIYGDNPTYNLKYSDDKGTNWVDVTIFEAGSGLRAFFDAEDSDKVWYKTEDKIGSIKLSTKISTSCMNGISYKAFSTLVQNPKKPNHMLLGLKGTYSKPSPTLYESVDYGNSWHVVPGMFGRHTINTDAIAFSTTTNEAFIGSHNGTIVYEYDKFRYYKPAKLRYENQVIYQTLERYGNEVIAPMQAFFPEKMTFEGWEYGGTMYKPGDRIEINN